MHVLVLRCNGAERCTAGLCARGGPPRRLWCAPPMAAASERPLRLVTWNVNGLASVCRRRGLAALLAGLDGADIVCLQVRGAACRRGSRAAMRSAARCWAPSLGARPPQPRACMQLQTGAKPPRRAAQQPTAAHACDARPAAQETKLRPAELTVELGQAPGW